MASKAYGAAAAKKDGYVLPEGWTWKNVKDARKCWATDLRFVPLAISNGVVVWGIYKPSDAS